MVLPQSDEGQKALNNMVALSRQDYLIGDTLGLVPQDHCCPVTTCGKTIDHRSVRHAMGGVIGQEANKVLTRCIGRLLADQRGRHILQCQQKYLQQQYGYAKFCWLGCFQWFITAHDWEQHCQGHLDTAKTLPVQWGLLIFKGAIAAPGICGWCIATPEKSGWQKLRQYLSLAKFKQHIKAHLTEEQEKKTVRCPD